MREAYNQLLCGVVVLNHEGVIVNANAYFQDWLQQSATQLIGTHIEQYLSVANKFIFHSYFYPTLHLTGQIQEFILHFQCNTQQLPAILSAIKTIENDVEHIYCAIMPMTKRIAYEQELRTMTKQLEQANIEKDRALQQLQLLHSEIEQKQLELIALTNTDKLTNIYNRRYIENRLAESILKAQADDFSVLILDIDFFKKVNDTYGHQKGDYVLIEIARLMKDYIGERGIVARYGGEEFLVLLYAADFDVSCSVATALNAVVRQHLFEHVQKVTISIGISTYREGDTDSMLINRADRALYYSKQHGRDRSTHFRDIENVLHS